MIARDKLRGAMTPRPLRILGAIITLVVSPTLFAQTTGGSLGGRVTDEKKSPLATVLITATHAATGLSRSVTTASDGRYIFPWLPTGSYQLLAESAGFASITVRKIDLYLGTQRHVDVRMRRTDEEEQVTITAPLRMVESTPAISTTVIRDFFFEVPLRERNALELAMLAPFAGPQSVASPAEVLFGGATTTLEVPLDAIEQMAVTPRQYKVEYQRSSGGVILLAPRLGSNEYEGAVAAFYRNRTERWQWSAAAGGPIVEDRSHFFAAIDGDRPQRGLATASVDLSPAHFVEADLLAQRFHGTGTSAQARNFWLARHDVWNEFVAKSARGGGEIRESLAGSIESSGRIRHDWRTGAELHEGGDNAYFFQDELIAGKLALTGGIRYDSSDDRGRVSSRVGWIYDVNGSGRNLLRGGYGQYIEPDSADASIGYSWQTNAWVAVNVDLLHSDRRNLSDRNALAVSGHVQFSPFLTVAGSYTFSRLHEPGDFASHVAGVAGTIHLPGGFWISGLGSHRSSVNDASPLTFLDLRGAKSFELPGERGIDAMVDVFNVLDRSGQPRRSAQLGLRVNF